MTDHMVATKIKTPHGVLEFQEYFVKRKFQDKVEDVTYEGAAHATRAPGGIRAVENTDVIILRPSNPILSIGPMSAVPEIRNGLARTRAKIGGISRMAGGSALKG